MATEAQIESMLTLMQQQMTQVMKLQEENTQLRSGDTGSHQQTTTRKKTKTPDRPTVDANIDDREWELFKDSWWRYKTMTDITSVDDIRMELRAACSKDVNRLLFEFVGATTLDNTTEDNLLAHIRSVAVKGTHKEVHRMSFSKLSQMEGKTITQFVARLKSQAALCQFTITCRDHEPPKKISFADEMVAQQLTTGLKNPNHQSKILSEAGTLTTLKAKIERLQCLESTEESTNQMRGPPGNQASRSKFARQSAHRRSTRPNPPPNNRNTKPNSPLVRNCRGCGRHSHGNGKSMARRNCPAYSKTCANCGITGHFKAVCSRLENNSKSQANIINEEESVEEHFNTEPYDQSFAFSTTTQNQDFWPSYHIIGRP